MKNYLNIIRLMKSKVSMQSYQNVDMEIKSSYIINVFSIFFYNKKKTYVNWSNIDWVKLLLK